MPTNEVFTSLRLCDSARQTNALARPFDAYSRPAVAAYGYDDFGRTLSSLGSITNSFRWRLPRPLADYRKNQIDFCGGK